MTKVERNQSRKTLKLNPAKAEEIRSQLKAGVPVPELASQYEVARSLIEKIGRREVWV
jgi:hypothetical protein